MNILAINCSSASLKTIVDVIVAFFTFGLVIFVIGFIIVTMFGFMKAVSSEKADNAAEFKMMMKRIVNVVLMLLIVPIVMFIMDIVIGLAPISEETKTCFDLITKKFTIGGGSSSSATIKKDYEKKCTDKGGIISQKNTKDFDKNTTTLIPAKEDGKFTYICVPKPTDKPSIEQQ